MWAAASPPREPAFAFSGTSRARLRLERASLALHAKLLEGSTEPLPSSPGSIRELQLQTNFATHTAVIRFVVRDLDRLTGANVRPAERGCTEFGTIWADRSRGHIADDFAA